MFVNQWTNWQFDLDAETFDGNTEIVIWVDFSAVYKMPDHLQEKYKHVIYRNQLVALVLHSPEERNDENERRTMKFDYWRIWSQEKGDPSFHQMAMQEICMFYKNARNRHVLQEW